MEAHAGTAPRGSAFGLLLAFAAFAALALGTAHTGFLVLGLLLVFLLPLAIGHRWLFAWRQQVAVLLLVILFIPIQLYSLGGGLPFQLEPYRILVALMVAGWAVSLLIDPAVSFRRTGLEWPIGLILAACVLSELANAQRIASLNVNSEVTKGLTFVASFFLIVYLVMSVIRRRSDVVRLVEVLCAGGGILGIFAIVEYRTKYDFFFHLHSFLPFLNPLWADGPGIVRGGDLRVFASAQHPIALGALFVMLLPLSVYLATRPGKRIWWIVAAGVMIGAISSVSRTTVIMLVAVALVFFWLRPRQTVKAWPLLVPAVLAIQVAVPGALRSIESSFFPRGGLIAQQSSNASFASKNRLSRIGPTLKEWSADPLVGEGYATRQPALHPETFVLDNQWLKSLVETGLLGFFGWLWLFVRSVRRLARASREDGEDGRWLEVALAASITSFAVGMLFYDAFSFIQVTVMLLILVALSSALVQAEGVPRRRQARVPSRIGGRRLAEVEPEPLA